MSSVQVLLNFANVDLSDENDTVFSSIFRVKLFWNSSVFSLFLEIRVNFGNAFF